MHREEKVEKAKNAWEELEHTQMEEG